MTIALSRPRRFSAARYQIAGEISKKANWTQVIELPADGETVSISGHAVSITFRENADDDSATLTLTSAGSDITITDADTLTMAATVDDLSGLQEQNYFVDITSTNGGVTYHWAHGLVTVRNSPI